MATNANAIAYNPELIENCVRNLDKSWNGLLISSENSIFQTTHLLRSSWYGPNAIKVVNPFIDRYCEAIQRANDFYLSIVDKINAAAANYANAAGGAVPNVGFTVITKVRKPEGLLNADSSGAVGIVDKATYQQAITYLKTVSSLISEHLNAGANAVTNTGFIDSGTESAIGTEFARIKTDIFNLIDDMAKQLESNLNENRDNLESVQRTNMSSFGG